MRRSVFEWGLFFLAVAGVILAGRSNAGTLSITSGMTLTVLSDQIQVRVSAANHGTGPAYHLQGYLHIFGRKLAAKALDRLEVNQSQSFHFSVPMPSGKKGEFPFVSEVIFHDDNRHPFTALSGATFKLDSAGDSKLIGQSPQLTIIEKGRWPVEIISLDPEPRNVIATAYLPRGLETPARQKQISVGAFKTAMLNFPLTYRLGTGGATYPLFCALEYDENGIHHTVIVRSTARIEIRQNWFNKTRWYWLGGMLLLLLVWVAIGLTGRMHSNPKRAINSDG